MALKIYFQHKIQNTLYVFQILPALGLLNIMIFAPNTGNNNSKTSPDIQVQAKQKQKYVPNQEFSFLEINIPIQQ